MNGWLAVFSSFPAEYTFSSKHLQRDGAVLFLALCDSTSPNSPVFGFLLLSRGDGLAGYSLSGPAFVIWNMASRPGTLELKRRLEFSDALLYAQQCKTVCARSALALALTLALLTGSCAFALLASSLKPNQAKPSEG